MRFSYGRCEYSRLTDFATLLLYSQPMEVQEWISAKAAEYVSRDGMIARDEFFAAEQNARVARNAEEYYRIMFENALDGSVAG